MSFIFFWLVDTSFNEYTIKIIKEASETNITKKLFFCKQAVYKQLSLGWQIAKQLSGLNPLSLSNNKTTD